jgi:hypothetical protein
MDLETIVKELEVHNEMHPGHKLNCPDLDIHVVVLHGYIANQEKKVKEQLLQILRDVLNWDKMRGRNGG